jgi:hypothetical protein
MQVQIALTCPMSQILPRTMGPTASTWAYAFLTFLINCFSFPNSAIQAGETRLIQITFMY